MPALENFREPLGQRPPRWMVVYHEYAWAVERDGYAKELPRETKPLLIFPRATSSMYLM
jgi:hypothetical protein